jgi:energy-coupling factor transporter ATP-binding protein EcfA2
VRLWHAVLEKRSITELLEPLEQLMEGNVELTDSGQFYLNIAGVRMEMHLVAEGLRKLAMIARLIATGALIDKGYLFWDEPEANLNPRVIKRIARTILLLCQNGIQVFVASHSLFLLRELDVLLHSNEFKAVARRYFGLHKAGDQVTVEQGDSVDDIGSIAALEEELSQSDRYLESEAR